MTGTVPMLGIRDRLRDLNTKAYYLLVALSFIYRTSGTLPLKVAITLTALVAVLPVQDRVTSERWLDRIRLLKGIGLWAALAFTLYWIWTTGATTN